MSEMADITEAVKEMANHEDANQIARILDAVLSEEFGARVVNGYNDNHRYKVVR